MELQNYKARSSIFVTKDWIDGMGKIPYNMESNTLTPELPLWYTWNNSWRWTYKPHQVLLYGPPNPLAHTKLAPYKGQSGVRLNASQPCMWCIRRLEEGDRVMAAKGNVATDWSREIYIQRLPSLTFAIKQVQVTSQFPSAGPPPMTGEDENEIIPASSGGVSSISPTLPIKEKIGEEICIPAAREPDAQPDVADCGEVYEPYLGATIIAGPADSSLRPPKIGGSPGVEVQQSRSENISPIKYPGSGEKSGNAKLGNISSRALRIGAESLHEEATPIITISEIENDKTSSVKESFNDWNDIIRKDGRPSLIEKQSNITGQGTDAGPIFCKSRTVLPGRSPGVEGHHKGKGRVKNSKKDNIHKNKRNRNQARNYPDKSEKIQHIFDKLHVTELSLSKYGLFCFACGDGDSRISERPYHRKRECNYPFHGGQPHICVPDIETEKGIRLMHIAENCPLNNK